MGPIGVLIGVDDVGALALQELGDGRDDARTVGAAQQEDDAIGGLAHR